MAAQSARMVTGSTGHRLTAATDVAAMPRPAWLDARLFPFQSHYINIDGNLVHYVDEGHGPILLFLHSNVVWSFTYRHLMQGLRDSFRCIALDFPGFGLSTAAAGFEHAILSNSMLVEKIMQALDLSNVTVLGHDTGGPIGLGVVSRHPQWFRALILLDTFCFPLKASNPKVAMMLNLISSPFPGVLLVDYLNLMVEMIDRQGMKLRKLSKAEKAAFAGPFADRSSRRVMRALFASVLNSSVYLTEMQQKLKHVNIPALLLPAEKSGAVETLLPGLEATFANHQTVILKGAGHFSAEDSPDEVVSAIRNWWQTDIEKK